MRTVDVSVKPETLREAAAEGLIRLKPETVKLIKENRVPKGNVLEACKLAGIMAAKKTAELLPFCHPLPFDHAEVTAELGESYLKVRALVRGVARTGYEMEALTAVSAALLTVYDMCKGFDDEMRIEGVRLTHKRGGKSDWFADLKGVRASVHAEDEKLEKLVKGFLAELGATFSENADLFVSVGENLPMGRELRGFESVVALYDFARDPTAVAKEVRVGRTDEALLLVLPPDEGKITQFFKTFGGLLRHLL
ncbi:MAG: cyclic pyranopterin monophosphate synthase MoaC [Aquificae bacterium]|nr:cyclic pyranopterin monophosphate synthase MoaC [Aquificota bacterium]